jgi:hypothetical protein
MRVTRFGVFAFAGCLALNSAVLAGPLDPPGGPVAGTMKPLDQVEPRIAINAVNTPGDADSLFRIAEPGSYYLTGNVDGAPGKIGIEIAASGVTLDLGGFCLDGDVNGIIPSLDGVRVSVLRTSITVRNGAVRNWGEDGIDLVSAQSGNVEDVMVDANSDHGIVVGPACTVERCGSSDNGGDGIRLASGGGTARECTSSFNTGDGFRLIGAGSRVVACTAHTNSGDGIQVDVAGVIQDNVCTSNGYAGATGYGIHVTGAGSRLESNTVQYNDIGIKTLTVGSLIARNIATSNFDDYDVADNGFNYGGFGGINSIETDEWYQLPWTNFK